jgi:hypothetical protein
MLKGELGFKCVIGGTVPIFYLQYIMDWRHLRVVYDGSNVYDVELIDESIGGIGPDPLHAKKKKGERTSKSNALTLTIPR